MSLYPSKNTKGRAWFPLIAWMVVIFFFSTDTFSAAHTEGIIAGVLKFLFPFLSMSQLVFWHVVCRKAGHVTEYSILGFLAWRTFSIHPWVGVKPKLFAAVFVLVFAFSDELHQVFVASRSGSLVDVGYDFIGGLIVLMFLPGSRNEPGPLPTHSIL